MWSSPVVALTPCFYSIFRVFQGQKPAFTKAFLPKTTVEGFDKGIVRRFSRAVVSFVRLNQASLYADPDFLVDILDSVYYELTEKQNVTEIDAPRLMLIGPNVAYGDYKVLELVEAAEARWLKSGAVAHCAEVKTRLGLLALDLFPRPDLGKLLTLEFIITSNTREG